MKSTQSRFVSIGSLAGLALLLVSAHASATPNFPGVIADHLELAAPPQCSLCHAGGVTGRGTVNTPFGATMRARGAQAYDEESIHTALDALAAEDKDSDQDGTGDIEELLAGADPNAATGEDVVQPEHGCTASPRRSGGAWIALGIALVAVTTAVRRRR